jgi:hypothetical protein
VAILPNLGNGIPIIGNGNPVVENGKENDDGTENKT